MSRPTISVAGSRAEDNSLVPCAISPRIGSEGVIAACSIFADVVTVRVSGHRQNIASPAKRGNVTTFSRRSRMRALLALAEYRKAPGRLLFLTLTFPDEVWFGQTMADADLEMARRALVERFKRRFPAFGCIWRKEWETRKSGKFTGQIAPHMHWIIAGLDGYDMADLRHEVRAMWFEILKHYAPRLHRKPRIDLNVVRNRRHAYFYVSKYIAKLPDDLADADDDDADCDEKESSGRWWGVVGIWDRAAVLVVHLTREQLVALRRMAARWKKSQEENGGFWHKNIARGHWGFSLFSLGDLSLSGDVWGSTIFRMIWAATSA